MSRSVAGIICDLDGVLYRGDVACPGAAAGIASARAAGVRLLFMTNNASRTPVQVAEHLRSTGVPAAPEEVLTSSQVGAAHLEDLRRAEGLTVSGAPVLAVGGPGVGQALDDVGLQVVRSADVGPLGPERPFWAVLQGFGPDLRVSDLHEAAYAIRAGAHWVATNSDATLPTSRGLAPGNGSLVTAVAHGTGASPVVVGKPWPASYRTALQRLDLPAERVLAIGDRIDTDIEGALACGIPAALVLTGVDTEADVQALAPGRRPAHVAPTIPDLAHLWS